MKDLMPKLLALQNLELSLDPRSPQEEETVLKLRAEMPKPILYHFDRLIARGKKGVAVVRGTSCSECHLVIPIGTMHQLEHQDDAEIHLCDNCGRYLYAGKPASKSEPAINPARKSGQRTSGNVVRCARRKSAASVVAVGLY